MANGDITDALRDRVRARCGQPSQSGLEERIILLFLNEAQFALGWRLDDAAMPEMTEIATGNLTNSRVGLPTDYWRERFVTVGASKIEARTWPFNEYDALVNNALVAPSTAEPKYFIWENVTDNAKRLMVYQGAPTSAAAYELYYVKTPVTATTDQDPTIGPNKNDLLVDYATWRCLQTMRQRGQAKAVYERLLEKLNTLNGTYSPGVVNTDVAGDAPKEQ